MFSFRFCRKSNQIFHPRYPEYLLRGSFFYLTPRLEPSYILSRACRITSRLLLNLRQGIQNGTLQKTSCMSTSADCDRTTRFSGEFMNAMMGNIGEDFEEEESSTNFWSTETRRSWSTEDLESGYRPDYSPRGPDVIAVESIQASELRMERPRPISWSHIRGIGVTR
jgi:hypothetical protein